MIIPLTTNVDERIGRPQINSNIQGKQAQKPIQGVNRQPCYSLDTKGFKSHDFVFRANYTL